MKNQLCRLTFTLCLVALTVGCVKQKRKCLSVVPPASFSDSLIIGYSPAALPIYAGKEPSASPVTQDRMLTWKARLSIEVGDVSNAVAQAVAVAEERGGYLESRSDSTYSGTTLQLRIPSKSFTDVVGSVEALGAVTSRQVESKDVTEQYVDTEARLKNKIVLRDRLRGLLDKASEVKDILAIETELNRIQGDIDSMEALIKSLKGKVDFATINLTFILKEEKPKTILGPLGLLFKGVYWTVEKLFVIRK